MADPHVITALLKRRGEIAGQIEYLSDQLRQTIIDLDNVDHTIHLFDPSIELQDIKTRPVPPRHKAFKGEVSRIVFQTLRNAKKPLTTAEIASRVAAERGLDTASTRTMNLMAKRVGSSLREYRAKGHVTSEMGPDKLLVWSVK